MDSLGGHAFPATPRIPPSKKQENIVVIACVAFLILVSVKGAFGDRQQRITTFTLGAAFASACVVTYGFYRAQMDTNLYPPPYVIRVDASQGQIDAAADTNGAGRFLTVTGRNRIRPKTYFPVSFPGTGVQLALPDVREFDGMPTFVFVASICLFLAYASFHYQDVDPSLKWLVLPGMFCLARFVHGFYSDQRQHLGGDDTLRMTKDRLSAMRFAPADPKPRVGQPGHTGRH